MKATIVLGLGFGDEGKGAVVDGLVRRTGAELVVRFNGGAQAAHHVVTPEGKTHRFSTWGSGTLAGALTYLGPKVMFDPVAAQREAARLATVGITDPWRRLYVDAACPVITPWHVAINRIRQRAAGLGSCGMGIGALAEDIMAGLPVLTAGDLIDGSASAAVRTAKAIRDRLTSLPLEAVKPLEKTMLKTTAADWVEGVLHTTDVGITDDPMALVKRSETVIFEGAQGVLLDEQHGFHPHTTWSTTTDRHARAIIEDWNAWRDGRSGDDVWAPITVTTIGVLRAFATRHGSGPFPTEIASHECPRSLLIGEHNEPGPFQGRFRVGHFDAVLARYALGVQPVDGIALTCLDRVDDLPDWKIGIAYDAAGVRIPNLPVQVNPSLDEQQALGEAINLSGVHYESCKGKFATESIENYLGAPVVIETRGATADEQSVYAGRPVV